MGAPPANTGGAPDCYLGKYFTSFLLKKEASRCPVP